VGTASAGPIGGTPSCASQPFARATSSSVTEPVARRRFATTLPVWVPTELMKLASVPPYAQVNSSLLWEDERSGAVSRNLHQEIAGSLRRGVQRAETSQLP